MAASKSSTKKAPAKKSSASKKSNLGKVASGINSTRESINFRKIENGYLASETIYDKKGNYRGDKTTYFASNPLADALKAGTKKSS